MRAVWYSEFGSASEVLTMGELETPEPGVGEVRVRMSVSGVNPVDVKRRAGGRGGVMDTDRVIPHFDGAGVIDKTGDGVNGLQEGDRVWIFEARDARPPSTSSCRNIASCGCRASRASRKVRASASRL